MKLRGVLMVVALVLASCGGGQGEIVVAVGTTLDDSGFMDALVGAYEAEFPERAVIIVGRSSPEVLALGGAGSADLLITHAPRQEAAFVAEGLAERSEQIFGSQFVLVAPPDVAVELQGMGIEQVLRGMFDRTLPYDFISRGDNSGTHQREQELWEAAGLDIHEADWYLEAGQGMGAVLQIASQKEAVTLTELGAFLGTRGLQLSEVQIAGEALANPYTAIVPVGGRQGADHFLDWILQSHDLVKQINGDLFRRPVYELVLQENLAGRADCPVTLPGTAGMAAPDPFPRTPSLPGHVWFGSADLWTALPVDGVYGPRKSVWWSENYSGSESPALDVTWEQIDGELRQESSSATGGFTPEDDWFMIGGLDPTELGCWEITATFNDSVLTYVVYIP